MVRPQSGLGPAGVGDGVRPPCRWPQQVLQTPGPSPALGLAWRWSRRQTLPGRSQPSWGREGGTAWAGLQRGGSQEEEEEEEGRWPRLRGPTALKVKVLFLPVFGPP